MPTLVELKAEAKKLGLKGYSKLKKADLEKLIFEKTKSKYVPQSIPSFKGKPVKTPVKKTSLDSVNKTELEQVMDYLFADEYDNIFSGEIRDVKGEMRQQKELERASRVAYRILNKMIKAIYDKAKNDKELKKLGIEWLRKNYY